MFPFVEHIHGNPHLPPQPFILGLEGFETHPVLAEPQLESGGIQFLVVGQPDEIGDTIDHAILIGVIFVEEFLFVFSFGQIGLEGFDEGEEGRNLF